MRNSVQKFAVIASFLVLTLYQGMDVHAGEAELVLPAGEPKIVGSVVLSKTAFNPSLGEKLALDLELKKPADVTVRVYDADWREAAILADNVPMLVGKSTLLWDGRDLDGIVVPDEAYFFTVEAQSADGAREVYDPTVFSGGEEADIIDAKIDPLTGTVRYRLPKMARVSIRVGITGGPLLKTLVDWKPRPAGEVTEYWDGKDNDGLIDVHGHSDKRMIITYFTLPENSVITFGNKQDGRASTDRSKRPKKQETKTGLEKEKKISPHYRIPRQQDVSPEIVVGFPNKKGEEQGTVLLSGRAIVHVDLDGVSKKHLQNTKFEIVFFLDGRFYTEEETGYAPYNWVWDTSQVDEGTYLLTVNLSSFKDQIGVKTRKVKVVH